MDSPYERQDGLYCVSKDPRDAVVNVVFVHGLGGGGYSTWDCGAGSDLGFWPAKIADKHPRCCVWTLHYQTPIFERSPLARSRIDLLDRAVWVVQSLLQNQVHARPIVFVAHSLGGLVVKQALQFACSLGPPEWRRVWDQTQAVVFLATPHVGAQLADVALLVAGVVREAGVLTRLVMRPSIALKNLVKNNPTLRYLSDWYRDQAPEHGIQTLAFSEGRACKGVLVVDESSANPQVANGRVIPLPEDDHISIAKPRSERHLVYAGVSSLLEDLEKAAAAGAGSPRHVLPRPDKVTLARQAENQRLIDALCGDWWERIMLEGASAVSLLRISPDPLFNSLILGGTSYDAEGEPSADWSSVIARVDQEGGKLVIKYVWTGKHRNPKIAHVPFHGFGAMRFDAPADPGDPVSRGSGDFWDVDESTKQTLLKPIELRRVTNHDDLRTAKHGTKQEIKALIHRMLAPASW